MGDKATLREASLHWKHSFRTPSGIVGWGLLAFWAIIELLEWWHLGEFVQEKLGHVGPLVSQILDILAASWFQLALVVGGLLLIAYTVKPKRPPDASHPAELAPQAPATGQAINPIPHFPIGKYIFAIQKQEREELDRFRAEGKARQGGLNLDVFVETVQIGEWGPIRGEGNETDEFWAKIWLLGMRITNRSGDPVSLGFSLEVKFGETKYSVAPHRCSEEEVKGLKCFTTPLAIRPKSTAVGSLGFRAAGPPAAWRGDPSSGQPMPRYLLTLTDHVLGKSITVEGPM